MFLQVSSISLNSFQFDLTQFNSMFYGCTSPYEYECQCEYDYVCLVNHFKIVLIVLKLV